MLTPNLMGVALTAVLVSPAFAHPGVAQVTLASGIAHPLGGADHILAMIAIGLWAVLAGGRAIWIWPMAFVATMFVGFQVASLGLPMPSVEPAILSSIVILGLFVGLAVKAPLGLGAAIAGFFALFHGYAHGTETTALNLMPYAVGFALATAALHAMGIGLGLFAERSIGKVALRALGGLTVLSGLALIVG